MPKIQVDQCVFEDLADAREFAVGEVCRKTELPRKTVEKVLSYVGFDALLHRAAADGYADGDNVVFKFEKEEKTAKKKTAKKASGK